MMLNIIKYTYDHIILYLGMKSVILNGEMCIETFQKRIQNIVRV